MKKLIICGAIVAALAVVFVGGDTVWYHVKSAYQSVRGEIADAIPVDEQLNQAENMILDLGPEIETWERKVDGEDYEIERLGKTIQGLEREMAGLEGRIKRNKDRLQTETISYSVAGRNYSRGALAHRVKLDLEEYKRKAALVTNKKRTLKACTRSHAAAVKRLETVQSERENLSVLVEQLRAQLRENEALAATTEPLDVDDSKLAEVKRILARCHKRLAVDRKGLQRHGAFSESFSDDVTPEQVVEEVNQLFGSTTPATAEALTPVAVDK